jgi:hypothetical protein
MEELLFYLFRLITILGSSSALCTKRNSPVVDDGLEHVVAFLFWLVCKQKS